MEKKPNRLVVVSNRLPVTLKKSEDGSHWVFKQSSGGLVAGLAGLKKTTSFLWIGWPGFEIPDEDKESVEKELLDKYACIPVFLKDEVAVPYYNTFANSILWPLFHYLPVDMNFDEESWSAYLSANSTFADIVIRQCKENDLIWVHDYQLMMLPHFLRSKLDSAGISGVKIGFFLHIPFPTSEIFKILPVASSILHGLLASDLIGFHTFEYGRHFISSCSRILGLSTQPTQIKISDERTAQVGIYPIGIDPDPFIRSSTDQEVTLLVEKLRTQHKNMKIILGIDRLDYIKGIQHKFLGFEHFLKNYPKFQNQVILIQVAVPTREDVEEYKNLISSTNQLVGHINRKHGSIDYTPLHFINKSVPFVELAALYRIANICIVTSIRDGMNLVSYEFIAAQTQEDPGVLILSEFAGAAQSFNGALIVNPWDLSSISKAIETALTMPLESRKEAHQSLLQWVTKYTSANWGVRFTGDLANLPCSNGEMAFPEGPTPPLKNVAEIGSRVGKLPPDHIELVIVDKSGSKMIEHRPILKDQHGMPPAHMIHLISSLSSLPNISTFVWAGNQCPTSYLMDWFGPTGAGIIRSEDNGDFFRPPSPSHRQFDNHESHNE